MFEIKKQDNNGRKPSRCYRGNRNLPLATLGNLKLACVELGIPDDKHTLRRASRAFDLYNSGKVEHLNDHTFAVKSQYRERLPYQVHISKSGTSYCTCPDWRNYSGDLVLPDVHFHCKHAISARIWLHHNGNGWRVRSHALGDLVHKLSNGEYVISYNGIMALAEQHNVTFTKHTVKSDAKRNGTVIAHARRGNNTRASGKPMNGSFITAVELAKRNAARQLLPLPEIKALEHKAKLEAEFSWEKAKAKCLELVPDFTLDILINDMVRARKASHGDSTAGKLEQKHSSDYSRREWLLIFDAVKRDAETNGNDDNDGGGKPLPSDKFAECRDAAQHPIRYSWLKADMLKEGVVSDDWTDDDIAKLKEACEIDASLFGKELGHWTIDIQPNTNRPYVYQRRYWFWLMPMSKRCFWCGKSRKESILPDTCIHWGRYEIKASLCLECSEKVGKGELDKDRIVQKFDNLYNGNGCPNTVVTSENVYGGRKIRFEIDTVKPNWVTIHYDNGTCSTTHSETIYESVLGDGTGRGYTECN